MNERPSQPPTSLERAAALRECESEPIRTPGQVQPHGALLLCSAAGELIGASESVTGLLGFMPAGRLGQPVADLLGKPFWSQLQRHAIGLDAREQGPVRFVWEHPFGKEMDCWVSWCAEGWLVDSERRHYQKAEAALLASARTLQTLAAGERLKNEAEIAGYFANAARRLLGFDHVMVYRFHEDWHGEVIAESTDGDWDRWLGFHWPATDIPAQARALYLVAPVRQIPDVDARPSALRLAGGQLQPDLGRSTLRSTSPYHLQYMRNMGVRASLVGSLIDEGRLWGLVACHHHDSPLYTCAEEREAFEWLCRELMLRLARRREAATAAWSVSLAAQRSRALELDVPGHEDILDQQGHALMGLAAADGAAWMDGGRVSGIGLMPPAADLTAFLRLWEADADGAIRHTDNLRGLADKSTGAMRAASQALLASGIGGVAIAGSMDLSGPTIAWFRREWQREIRWGGNPEQPLEVDGKGRAWPRTSFASWLQSVRGSSRAWEAAEIESMRSFFGKWSRRTAQPSGSDPSAAPTDAGTSPGTALQRAVFEGALQMCYRVLAETAPPNRRLGWGGWPFVRVGGQSERAMTALDWAQLDPDARAAVQHWIMAQAQVDQGAVMASETCAVGASLSVPAWIGAMSIARWRAVLDRCRSVTGASGRVTLALDVQDALAPEVSLAVKKQWVEIARECGIELRAWGLGRIDLDLDALGASGVWASLWWAAPPASTKPNRTEALWAALLSRGGPPCGCALAAHDHAMPSGCALKLAPGDAAPLPIFPAAEMQGFRSPTDQG